jgi:hypothetical protein
LLRSRAVTEARSDTTGRGDPGKIITMAFMEKNAGGAGESDGGNISSDVDSGTAEPCCRNAAGIVA